MKTKKIIYIFLFLLIVFSSFTYANVNTSYGLIHYYNFSFNANDYFNFNDGTVTSATHNTTDCFLGNCYTFDGNNDVIDLDNDDTYLDDHSVGTVCYAIYPYSVGGTLYKYAVNLQFDGNELVTTGTTSQAIELQVRNTVNNDRLTTGNIISAKTWHYVCILQSGTNFEIWMDGTNRTYTYSSGSYNTQWWDTGAGGYDVAFGLRAKDRDIPFKGNLDEIAFWNKTLNTTEMQHLYNNLTNGIRPMEITLGGGSPDNEYFEVFLNNLTSNYWTNEEILNKSYYYVSSSIPQANCSLYINNSLIPSTNKAINNNTNSYMIFNFSDISIPPDNFYNYYINCSKDDIYNISDVLNLHIDTIPPEIIYYQPNNNTYFNYFNTSLYPTSNYIESIYQFYEESSFVNNYDSTGDIYYYKLKNSSIYYGTTILYNISLIPPTTIMFYSRYINVPQSNLDYIFYNITFTDLAGNLKKVLNYIFFYDDINPLIRLNSPSDENYLIYSDNVFINVTYSDYNLYKTNTTIMYENKSLIWNKYTENSSINYKNETISILLNMTINKSTENYILFMEAVDKHTSSIFDEKPIIEEYKNDTENIKNYNMDNGNIIFKYDNDIELKEIYETDRIIQTFNNDKLIKPTETYFDITADSILEIKNSDYACHLIINDDNMKNGYWYDCEGLNNSRMEKITDNTYRIYHTIYPDIISFSKSLGGLNYINKTLYFSLLNTDYEGELDLTIKLKSDNENKLIISLVIFAFLLIFSLISREQIFLIIVGIMGIFLGLWTFSNYTELNTLLSAFIVMLSVSLLYISYKGDSN